MILPPFWSLVNLHSLGISLGKMNLGKGYLDRLSLAPSWFSCQMEPCVQACSVSVFCCLLLVKHTPRSPHQIVISVELRIYSCRLQVGLSFFCHSCSFPLMSLKIVGLCRVSVCVRMDSSRDETLDVRS